MRAREALYIPQSWKLYFLNLFLRWGSYYVAQGSLKLLGSTSPPASARQVAGPTGVHHVWLWELFLSYIFSGVCMPKK